jgi:hypothetical protein
MLMMTASNHQSTLDGMVTSQPRIAPFSTWGFVEHVVELIVSEDDAFYLLDKPTFCWLIHYLQPTLAIKDIPHHTRIREVVLVHTVQAKSKLKETLQVCYAFVCYMKC